MRKLPRLLDCIFLAGQIAGCASIGPATIPRDRVDYAGAMAESWKEQTLLNIVKLRYLDTPMYVDVASVVASHELQTQLEATWRLYPTPLSSAQSYRNLEATGRYTNRPTISYVPLAGERFINGQLRPLPPQTIFAMIESGHPADFILRMAARAINDVFNDSRAPQRARTGSPDFEELISVFRRIQRSGAVGMRTERRGTGHVFLISFRSVASSAAEEDVRLIKKLLRLDPQKHEYILSSGSSRHSGNEIVLLTRSIQEIMAELALGIDVPPEDLAAGRATPGSDVGSGDGHRSAFLRVRSGADRPSNTFVTVRYGKTSFWVDDRDLQSKRVFMFLRMFTALAETGVIPQPAVVTIPAR